MSRQLLIYETAVPVVHTRHARAAVEPDGNYAFSAGINAVPLTAVEFARAASEYPLVFVAQGEEVMATAVLGIRGKQNLFVAADGSWQGRYVPAFLRRYPFVFSNSRDGKTLTLCIDESSSMFNQDGRGQRLFGDDGKPSAYVERVLKFLQEYQAHFTRTQAFARRLRDLKLLEPMQAEIVTTGGAKSALSGFLAVDRAKLRDLPGEDLAKLAKTDELELTYLHLHSLRNFEGIKDRMQGSLASAGAEETVETSPATS